MTEAEWLVSTDPATMLAALRAPTTPGQVGFTVPGKVGGLAYYASDRKLRLFAVACCRAVWDGVVCPQCHGSGTYTVQVKNPGLSAANGYSPLTTYSEWRGCRHCGGDYDHKGTGKVGGLTDPRSRRAVEVAERYADGEADYGDMARQVSHYTGYSTGNDAAHYAVRESGCPPAAQAVLLREVFGNPFHTRGGAGFISSLPSGGMSAGIHEPGGLPSLPSILRWHDGTIPRMAQRIYDERRWEDMPILADALMDAGCEDDGLIAHCMGLKRMPIKNRTPFSEPLECPHVRGCWVLDLLLGRQ